MDIFDAIILGIVQGLTEFLPVSSSGHLVMAQALLGVEESSDIIFEVALHMATLFAIAIFYFKRVSALAIGTLTGDRDTWVTVGKLVVATLPVVLLALVARKFIEAQFNSAAFAATMLLVTGGIVWTTRYTITKGTETEPSWRNAFIIGCAQAFAILPGISRSGTTVAVGMALGLTPLAAAEFSFLLGIIAMAGAAVLLLPDMNTSVPGLVEAITAGGIAALVSGLLALVAFIWLLKSKRFYVFSWYCWVVGSAFLAWTFLG